MIVLVGCGGGGSSSGNAPTNPVYNPIALSVMDADGVPLSQVSIQVIGSAEDADGNSISQFETGDTGIISFAARADDQAAITLVASKAGYLSTGMDISLNPDGHTIGRDLQLIKLDSTAMPRGLNYTAANVVTDTSGSVTGAVNVQITDAHNDVLVELEIPQNARLVTSSGAAVEGTLNIDMVDFDSNENSELLNHFPGGLDVVADNVPSSNGLTFTDGQGISFTGGKFTSLHIEDAQGNAVKNILSGSFTITSKISKQTTNSATGTKVVAGDSIEIWSYDEETGKWRYEETAMLQNIGHPEYLGVVHTTSHLSYRYYGYSYYYPPTSIISLNVVDNVNLPLQLGYEYSSYYGYYIGTAFLNVYNNRAAIRLYTGSSKDFTVNYFGQQLTTSTFTCATPSCTVDIDVSALLPPTKTVSIQAVESCADGSNAQALESLYISGMNNGVRHELGYKGDQGAMEVRLPATGNTVLTSYKSTRRYKDPFATLTLSESETAAILRFELTDEYCTTAGGGNTKPEATFDGFSVNENTVYSGQLTGSDAEASALSYAQVSEPLHGQLTINSEGSFSYTPDADYSGTDSFFYKVNDGSTDSEFKRVDVTVVPVPAAPVAADFMVETAEDTALSLGLATFAGNFTGNDLLTLELVALPSSGGLSVGGVAINAGDQIQMHASTVILYTPSADSNGSDGFSWKGKDSTDWSNTATASINVTPVADPLPEISDFNASAATITSGDNVDLSALFVNGDGSIDNGVGAVTSGSPVTLSPATTTTYNLTVTNVDGVSVTDTVTVTVVAPPSIASFTAASYDIYEGESTSLTAIFSGETASIDQGVGTISSNNAVVVSPATTTTYTLTVTNAAGAQVTQSLTVNVSVDPGTILTVDISDATLFEGDSGSTDLVFSVSTSGTVTGGSVSVDYASSDGTATAGSDYTAVSGTVTINDGSNGATIVVPVTGDTVYEGNETFTITLSNLTYTASDVFELGTSFATGVITDDDTPPTASIADVSVPEGDGGTSTMAFTVTLSGLANGDVNVNYVTSDNTATAGSDYTATSGTLTIAAGTISASIDITVSGDTTVESDETFTITLNNVSANATLGQASAVGTIVDDDSVPGVNISDASIYEGDSGSSNLTFTVTLSELANGDVNVDYVTSDGTAMAGSDYTASGGTLTISAGYTNASFDVPVNGDLIAENHETFTVTLSNVTANASLVTTTATGTIINNDVTGVLNDTGITTCANDSAGGLACPATGFPGQDAEFGRDQSSNDDSDGHAGFSFTKLDSNGVPLADQSVDYATNPWACVRDNVTGLVWEVKTDDGGLHDKDWTYTWYNSSGINDGDTAGAANNGSCVDSNNCDTEKFVAAVNVAGLCGATDWRLPSVEELSNLVDNSIATPGPTIDSNWFPNTTAASYWSSTPSAATAFGAWVVEFLYGSSGDTSLNTPYHVRLVRSVQ